MENQDDQPGTLRGFARWAIKPPQSYAVYLICLVLVYGASFYAGMLKPKNTAPISPGSALVPPQK